VDKDFRTPRECSIGEYGVIGDCRTAALVSRDGALDWLCLPHFSSPSVFGALLDRTRGGCFRISPLERSRTQRRYLPETNVLETTFVTRDGTARLIDAMPIPATSGLQPMREVLRSIEGIEGRVLVRFSIDPRPGYGARRPRLEKRGRYWVWTWGSESLHVLSDVALHADGTVLTGEGTLAAGERISISLQYTRDDIAVLSDLGLSAEQRLATTVQWWRDWSARARYEGPYREAVIRSALVLKLLTYSLSGAVVAAPTSSLPEWLGADRNWDYRYCWLRDAALTMRAFIGLGYLEEARAFFQWMLHATRLTWPRLQVLYDVYGGTQVPELQLDDWSGFCESKPVRMGNEAHGQVQLDVYGAVCLAARELANATKCIGGAEARLLAGLGATVCRSWRSPDHGIWEIRGERRHYTFSKVMCWAALDALVALGGRGMVKAPAHFATARDALRHEIESRGYNEQLASYVGVLNGTMTDASVLLMGCLGYQHPAGERMRRTFTHVHQRLSRGGLLYRYEPGVDGFDAPEGAFGLCSFWAVDNLAVRGDRAEAERYFDHVMRFGNDLGLFAEEIDPDSGELLGNFPQAYTHVGIINSAMTLQRCAAAGEAA
jgi:GH15 family glucan-1,4-alpha-glucosidase